MDRGKPCLTALLSFDLSLPGWQNVDLCSGRATGEIPCIARYYDGPIVSLDMASVEPPEDPSTLWARNECLVSQREAEKFVNEVISYLRSTGDRGGGGLVNRLYKCLQQVALISSVFGSFSVRVSLPLKIMPHVVHRRAEATLFASYAIVWNASAQTLSISLRQIQWHMLF